ncbi:MFS monocarboxylate transporter-like protein [Phaeosphaeria sp. MPI-PUGE-AT-0046c]|nr:MFS monocarboxylate transporter-like protein [Phaeosphaeria sp. MPI-PUGE-AT-0046c]
MELSPEPGSSYPAYPDGGKQAYSVVLGAWLTLFPASGLLNSTGILQAWLSEQVSMDYTESEISWIFSSFAFLFFFGGFIVGPLFERYGSKKLLPVGALGLIISLAATSLCKSYYQYFLAFGILGGCSSSVLWNISIATLGHWFDQKRALATGIATTAGGLGGVLFPITFTRLVPRIGFTWTMNCFALISTCCLLAGIALLKTRLPISPRRSSIMNWRGFTDLRFILTMSAIFILDWAVMVPPAYISTYAKHKGFQNMSNYLLAILNAASIVGRGVPGSIADKIGRYNVMILCSGVCTVSIFGLWLMVGPSSAILLIFAVLYGIFSGPAYSLTPVCVAQICRPEEYASMYGTGYGVVSFATLAGVPVSGGILGVGDGANYPALITFCGAAYAASTILFVVARGVSTGWRFRVKF